MEGFLLEDISFMTLAFLFVMALIAGFIDSIAGGGGMITIPSLLLAGIPPHMALGTNKLQGTFGSLSATIHFYKKGYLNIKQNIFFILSVFTFALAGTILVQFFSPEFLSKFIPILLILFALYFLFSPKIKEESGIQKVTHITLGIILGMIGAYDGLFGPGTGSFFMIALISLGRLGIKEALANAKMYNFTSNIASVLVFAINMQILWFIGFVMAVGQFIGANIGSRVAIRYSARVIKPFVVVTSIAVCFNMLYREYF